MIAAPLLLFLLSLSPQNAPIEEPPQAQAELLQFLSSIHIAQGVVAREAVCILCSIHVDGELTDEAVAVWGSVTVSGTVEREIVAVGGYVRLLPGSRVGEDVVAVGGRVYQDTAATVGGSVDEVAYLYFPGQPSLPWPGVLLFAAVILVACMLAAGLLRRSRFSAIKTVLLRRPVAVMLIGVLACVLIGLAGYVTFLLGPLEDWADSGLMLALLILAWLGSAALAGSLGNLLFPANFVASVAAGAVLLSLLLMIPVFGLVVLGAVFLAGVGAALLSGLGSDPDWLLARFRRVPKTEP